MKNFLYKTIVPAHYQPSWNPSTRAKVIGTVLFYVNLATGFRRNKQIAELRTEVNKLRAELDYEPLPPTGVELLAKKLVERVQGS